MDSEVRRLPLSTGITAPCLMQGDLSAKPLLLLHAWGESRRSFDRLIPLLDGFRILAPDLRGHGDADKPPGGYSLNEQVDDVRAILEALQLESVSVLGSSSGGYLAQQFAVTCPECVDGMVLVGSPVSLHGRPPFAAEVEALMDPVGEDWVRQSLAWFSLCNPVPALFFEDRIRDGMKVPAHAWKAVLEGLSLAVPPTEAGLIEVPTLILWGDQDNLLSRKDQEVLGGRILDSVLTVYPDVGHLVLWECPEFVAEDTKAFLLQRPHLR
jgi:pimeloyl-ACP methyl ester carboxylesterase